MWQRAFRRGLDGSGRLRHVNGWQPLLYWWTAAGSVRPVLVQSVAEKPGGLIVTTALDPRARPPEFVALDRELIRWEAPDLADPVALEAWLS